MGSRIAGTENFDKSKSSMHEYTILYGWHQKLRNKQLLNYALRLATYHIFFFLHNAYWLLRIL